MDRISAAWLVLILISLFSNSNLFYSRNKIRKEVIPILEDIHPGCSLRISYLAERNKLGFNMPMQDVLANTKNKKIIRETIESAKSKLERYIDYPLYLNMVINNNPKYCENILSLYVLSKWLDLR